MTHTYPEIKPADIREGDHVRWEHSDSDAACEWRQSEHPRSEHRPGTYFLMSRPTPPVELPTEKSLGRLTWYVGEESSGLGLHRSHMGLFYPHRDGLTDNENFGYYKASRIISWEPMTAVPTESLDALRKTLSTVKESGERREDIATFLADVDRANS